MLPVQYLSFKERQIEPADLMRLYRQADWWEEREETQIKKVLNGGIAVGAWNDNELIGFARAVSDGEFRAYIEDVVMNEEYRKTGIGTMMVSRLLDELTHIDIISLFCEKDLIPFYEKNNFKMSSCQYIMHRKKR
ncbi:GNAT family N-acetyltransferase [Rossellomorea oryzaecorticis]|uniref:GNAT family N-acetyltransferase n=1 Tax=Rossellomorea oryzaecorticis TaxID=1396505 RepID=A0ABW8VRU7_9BACI